MRFVFSCSLTEEAKQALAKGNGKHGRFAVEDNYIALLDDNGRATEWIKVIHNENQVIEAINAEGL